MKYLFFTIALFISTVTIAQTSDTQKELLKDVVSVQNGKFTVTDLTLVTLSNGNTLQIKMYAEAPATGVISRDNFVVYWSTIQESMLDELAKDDNATMETLSQLIGNADFEVNIYMTALGVQVETKSSTGVTRMTKKWSDYD